MPIPAPMPTGPRGCASRKRDGALCGQPAIAGTARCRMHAGKSTTRARAEGQVVVELSRWRLTDETLDPAVTLLRLMTQSVWRAELYGRLLEEAYEAAERLAAAKPGGASEVPSAGTSADRERALLDLERVFNSGGVAALIGHTYAADKEGGVFATGEAIRGLVQLEAQERDRAAGMAAKAVAAGLAERQVRLAEQQGLLVAQLIRGLLGDLGLDASDPGVARVVSARLRALDAGGAA